MFFLFLIWKNLLNIQKGSSEVVKIIAKKYEQCPGCSMNNFETIIKTLMKGKSVAILVRPNNV